MQITGNRTAGWKVRQPDSAHFVGSVFARAAGAMLVATAAAALVAYNGRLWDVLFAAWGPTPIGWIVILAPLPLALVFDRNVERMSIEGARAALWLWSLAIGASLATFLRAYTEVSIVTTFVGSAAGFGLVAWVGLFAHGNMHRLGMFGVAAMLGTLVVLLLNTLMGVEPIATLLALVGMIVFTGLAAYDIERLQRLYEGGAVTAGAEAKFATLGALTLSLDFLNLILSALRLTARRR